METSHAGAVANAGLGNTPASGWADSIGSPDSGWPDSIGSPDSGSPDSGIVGGLVKTTRASRVSLGCFSKFVQYKKLEIVCYGYFLNGTRPKLKIMAKQRAGVGCPPMTVCHICQIAQLPVVVGEPTGGSNGIDEVDPGKCYKSKPCYIPAKKWFVIQTNTAIKNSGTSHQKQGHQNKNQNALIFSDASKKPLLIAFQEVHCSSDIQAPVVRDAGKNWHCIAMACLSCQFRFNNNHVESESTPNPNQIPWVMLKSTWLVQKSSMFSSSPKFVYRRKWTPKVPTPIETLHVVFYAGQVAVRKAHISNAIATHLTLPPYPESTMISAGWPKMVCMTLNELMWEYTSAGWPWHWQKIDFQA